MKILQITYNCLNLPQRCEPRLHSAKRRKVSLPSMARALPSKITYGNGRTIAYVYDASGRKMQRTVYTPKVAVLNPRANELLMSGAKAVAVTGQHPTRWQRKTPASARICIAGTIL